MNGAGIWNLLLIVITVPLNVQGQVSERAIRQATQAEVERYALDAQQAQVMAHIQSQRLTNMAAIEPLKMESYFAYLEKCKSIRLYVEEATAALLSTERQKEIFASLVRERLEREGRLEKSLRQQGASEQQIREALLRLEEPNTRK
jgi:hypothetical protein